MSGLIIGLVVAAVVLVVVIWLWATYNGLIRARLNVKEAWSGIDVQLRRRSSLIPNLVETVKGYAAHERETFEAVTRARAQLDTARESGSAAQAAQADNILTSTLRSLFAVAEAYPDLKANENFKELQRELTDTEDKIAYSRQFYNTNVGNYNEKIQVFPNVLLAGMFNFEQAEFYEAEEGAREEITVSFSTP
ncbi:MAG: LemA family protein [Dehalococcoidia bacterium]